jgi:hypothetical protein
MHDVLRAEAEKWREENRERKDEAGGVIHGEERQA